ncbi:unnamed protein product [Pleuronectes platessa]|uniref:Uncharacterized protein n=1 Tax=Pleuronectes platessa TaxID=8262 RepID=A0A9N7TLW8_PLEPL|nr:unnamed protein product [Pleuronectes platessa]
MAALLAPRERLTHLRSYFMTIRSEDDWFGFKLPTSAENSPSLNVPRAAVSLRFEFRDQHVGHMQRWRSNRSSCRPFREVPLHQPGTRTGEYYSVKSFCIVNSPRASSPWHWVAMETSSRTGLALIHSAAASQPSEPAPAAALQECGIV